jgi:hypothetical protein
MKVGGTIAFFIENVESLRDDRLGIFWDKVDEILRQPSTGGGIRIAVCEFARIRPFRSGETFPS